jgi:23S rRNA-/tRNA-specific pseudouridylate synthase
MPSPKPNLEITLEVIDRLGDEAVIYKPAGLSSERGADDRGDSVSRQAEKRLCWHQWVSEQIRLGLWTKWYIARIAAGSPETLVGPHKAYLRREGRLARCVRSGGDPSRLEILAVARALDNPQHSHALIRLDTGRYHQIRAMLANLSAPLVGDTDYGGEAVANQAGFARIDLEAIALQFRAADSIPTAPTRTYRLRNHRDRVGVAAAIESKLDEVLA